jgi:uncharacterized protein YjbJ (UPF0337 family)
VTKDTTDTTIENMKGTVKEAAGKALGDEDLETEGQQQQKKALKVDEAEELQEAAEEKAAEAEGHAGAEKAAEKR